MQLDHFAVAAETLEEAVTHVEDALGVKMGSGGQHVHFGTHNRLIGLADGLYLEAIAVDPDAPTPNWSRWFGLDGFSGGARLSNWICRVPDLRAALATLPEGAGQPVALSRGDLRWQMAVPKDGKLPCGGAFPALLEWQVPVPPGDMLSPSGCRFLRLEVAHPDADWLRKVIPLSDPRVIYVEGALALRATFETPHGRRVLV